MELAVMTLIERLEKAGEGSREMDELVALETTHPYGVDAVDWDGFPAYTTSLDAALAMADRLLGPRGPIDLSICGSAQVVIHHHDPCGNPLAMTYAATPALALCLAVLRATQETT